MSRPSSGRQSTEAAGIPPSTVTYFHGKITRDQAEAALLANKALEGQFLLRESVNQNFAISICHGGRVHHYNIEKQPDGLYQIPTGDDIYNIMFDLSFNQRNTTSIRIIQSS